MREAICGVYGVADMDTMILSPGKLPFECGFVTKLIINPTAFLLLQLPGNTHTHRHTHTQTPDME